jgi:biofilm PGA synthesis N-glycosyltransferase PgaC
MDTFWLQVVFWAGVAVVFYAYLGYAVVLKALLVLKKQQSRPDYSPDADIPEVAFIVCAYNEADFIEKKIENSINVAYPRDRITYFFVTDGSDDDTPRLVENYPYPGDVRWLLLHQPERRGKIAAFQRAMKMVTAPVVVSTDANTEINRDAVSNLVRHFADPRVGAVAGEKRIHIPRNSDAGAAGEGIYWRYESALKLMDARFGSAIGAAGELFAFRTAAYEDVPADTLVEDFYMTMRMAMKGWRIGYEPLAFATEEASADIREEWKRKVRIAAGGLQAVIRLASLLDFFKYGKLSFQYISHRVLRWTMAPVLLPVLLVVNILLYQTVPFFRPVLIAQLVFYTAAFAGWIFENRRLRLKIFFVPYYFCLMNIAMYAGFFRLTGKKQSVLWEKARRRT